MLEFTHAKFLELSSSLHVLERTGDGVVSCPASMPLMFDRKNTGVSISTTLESLETTAEPRILLCLPC